MESLTLTEEVCNIETTVVTDGDGDFSQFLGILIPVDCFNGMADIFFKSDLYKDFPNMMINEDTGMFNGDTEALAMVTAQCTELGGRMTTSSMDYYGGECNDYVNLILVPSYVSNMCDDDEAQDFAKTYLQTSVREECEGTEITIDKMISEIETPKMPKAHKSPKAPKTPKEPKVPKAPKMRK